ncbi:glutamyl-tRNA reductase [Streptomyces sp. NPDC058249]|uniref:glutamyl-tRNA reductase n=1 Tax=Streptomyces sp. NPDC058249 TaxID=3346403 RepID=UPI0036EAE5A8
MTIVSLSLSHRITPAEVLEKLAVPSAQRSSMLARLHAVPSIDEVVVLSTCNRVEVYAAAHGPVDRVTRTVADLMAAHGQVPVADVLQRAHTRVDGAVAEHLFSVASGLDSMAVGEEQIVAQVKAAARAAADAGTNGAALTGLIDAALRTSKRVRTQTTISTEGISLARAGLDLAVAHLGGLATRHAVVLGTGSMGKLAARLLREAGVGRLSLAGRNQERVAEEARTVGGRHLRPDDMPAALADADILVTATGAAAPVVSAEQVRAARAQAAGRPLFVLDLGMPPDVDPAVGRLAGVTLADLTALGRHLADRAEPDQIPQARAIVAAEAAAYLDRQEQATAAPVIAAMHAQIRQLADAELARLHERLPDLSEQQRAETSATVHRILRKILHRPTVRAKEFTTSPNGPVYLDALRQLFDLSAHTEAPHIALAKIAGPAERPDIGTGYEDHGER